MPESAVTLQRMATAYAHTLSNADIRYGYIRHTSVNVVLYAETKLYFLACLKFLSVCERIEYT